MLKVMIVDNESAIRKGLVHCIHWGDLGCEIAAQADDGMMALEQIPVIQPNIVISDIRMPGMDGLELAEIIARDYPGIKVIILTGYPDFAYAQRAIQYHVVDFVLKPMTVENLTNAIEKAKAAIAEDRSSQDLQEKLSTTSARNMELQKSMLLHDLIHRVACSQLYVLNRLAQLKMDLRSYFVLKLHITSLSEEALTEEEYNEYLNQSQEILSDCLSSYQHYYIARGTQDCFVVICAAGEAPITALCREAVNIVGSLAHFLLFIGISNCNDNPICLADAADEAAQAVRFTVFTPDHPVTHFAELSSFPQQLTDEIFEMLSALKSAMELRNPADTEQLLDCIFAYADSNKLPPDTVRNICVYIHQFGMELQFPGMAGHFRLCGQQQAAAGYRAQYLRIYSPVRHGAAVSRNGRTFARGRQHFLAQAHYGDQLHRRDGILHPRTRAANAGHGAEQRRQRRPYRFLGTGLYQRTLR